MTAPNISVPLHPREPANDADRDEWRVEMWLRDFADTLNPWALAPLIRHRPDLTVEALQDLIDDVFSAAADYTDATVVGQYRAVERAQDRYAEALSALAVRPDDVMGVADALREPVKLGVVRGGRR